MIHFFKAPIITELIFSTSSIKKLKPLPSLPLLSIKYLSKAFPIPKACILNLFEFAVIKFTHPSLSFTKNIWLLKFILEYEKKYCVIKTNLKENSNIVKEVVNKTESILKEINDKRISKGLTRRSYRAVVLGVPNVGKSTLINRLAGRNIQSTGNIAGVTKNISWIKLNKDIELMDTPGILWPRFEDNVAYNLASLTSIKEEILNKDDIACYIIKTLARYYPTILKEKSRLLLIILQNIHILILLKTKFA